MAVLFLSNKIFRVEESSADWGKLDSDEDYCVFVGLNMNVARNGPINLPLSNPFLLDILRAWRAGRTQVSKASTDLL